MNARKIFLDYAERYDCNNGKIQLKIVHTFAVADVMDRLTAALGLDERQCFLAHVCAVFHDIGRFEQIKRYDTFLDHLSVDHAQLGCEVLEKEKFLEELPECERRMILAAIRNHNRYQIEEGLDDGTLLLCRLIRDADKCDIFRVFACEDMVDSIGETEEQVAQETITDEVYNSIFEHRCVKKEIRKTGLDKWVSFLAFFFDLYFDESVELLTQQRYYRQPFDRVVFADPDTAVRVTKVLEEIEAYIDRRQTDKMQGDFFHEIEKMNPNHRNMAMTVLEGGAFGEKALITNESLVWESRAGGFFSEHRAEIEGISNGGIIEIGGYRVFCEVLGQEKKLVICGGGHVSIPVIRMGLMIGCHVTVLEDRPEFADNARRANATEVFCGPFEEVLKKIDGDEDTYFIILTRGHRYDQICLEHIAGKPHAYIGMIGSRRRAAFVKEAIIASGGDREVIDRVHTPIGLDIGAETPEEIAVAIMAEIIEVKNKRRRNGGYSREILQAILAGGDNHCGFGHQGECHTERPARVLATIVERKGSAPRGAGAKMLILPDGTYTGTIGGGWAEFHILQKGLSMIQSGSARPMLCHMDLSGADEENEMICGGAVDVLLEVV